MNVERFVTEAKDRVGGGGGWCLETSQLEISDLKTLWMSWKLKHEKLFSKTQFSTDCFNTSVVQC